MQEPDMNFCAALNEKSLLLQGLFKKNLSGKNSFRLRACMNTQQIYTIDWKFSSFSSFWLFNDEEIAKNNCVRSVCFSKSQKLSVQWKVNVADNW